MEFQIVFRAATNELLSLIQVEPFGTKIRLGWL